MAERFVGKVVVVTGASAGIGAATSRRFAAEGARVVPPAATAPAAAAALLARAVASCGAVHVLVNNAGYNRRGPVENVPAEELARIVDVNLRAPIVLARLAIPYLRRAGGGAIVN